jgi:hypothetical protein
MLRPALRGLAITVAVFSAAVADLALPVWTSGPGFLENGTKGPSFPAPMFLDGAFILLCQWCGPAGAVFWGGATGVLGDVVRLHPPGTGMMLQATLAWFWVAQREEAPRIRRTPKLFPSLLLLIILGLGRLVMQSL